MKSQQFITKKYTANTNLMGDSRWNEWDTWASTYIIHYLYRIFLKGKVDRAFGLQRQPILMLRMISRNGENNAKNGVVLTWLNR